MYERELVVGRQTCYLVLAAAAFAICFVPVFVTLVQLWSTYSVYSHGFVVPLVSGYLVWTKRDKLRNLRASQSYWLGIPVIAAAIAMLVAGHLAALLVLPQAALVVAIIGFVLILYGRDVLACLWFPIAYLLLAIPIWNVIIGRLQAPSQILSASIAVTSLRGIGIPALREGTNIVLPQVTLVVLQACSGVNQLVSIVAIALPAAYLTLRSYARRVILVGLAVPIAYLSNGLRIALIGFLANRGLGSGDLGEVHVLEGLAVSSFGYLLLFGCLALLSRTQRTKHEDQHRASDSSNGVGRGGPLGHGTLIGAATFLVVSFVGACQLVFHPGDVPLRQDLARFPSRIDRWTIEEARRTNASWFPALDDDFLRAHPSVSGYRRFKAMDDELVRVYRNQDGDRVYLYIGYQRSQREGKELAGEASQALGAVAFPVAVTFGSRAIALNKVVRNQRSVIYWYDLNGRVVTDMVHAKAYMLWDGLTRWRTNGAVVMIASETPFDTASETSRDQAMAFAQAILPLLPHYLPS